MSADAEIVARSPQDFADQVAAAIAKHNPAVTVALVSGGHDSAGAIFASEAAGADIDIVAHANTGIGVEASREYVRDLAAQLGSAYIEGLPPEGDRIADIIMGKADRDDDRGSGWPGANPKSHGPTRERLKGRFKDKVQQSFEGTVVFITGVRRAESDTRWESLDPVGIDVSGRAGKRDYVWANPLTHHTKSDVNDVLNQHDVDRNPVRDYLGYSGECLCFAFESFLSFGDIAFVDPNMAHAMWWLMIHVNAWWCSFPEDDKPWPRQYLVPGHGGLKDRELRWILDGPLQDPADFRDSEPEPDDGQTTFPSCGGCVRHDPDDREAVVPDGGTVSQTTLDGQEAERVGCEYREICTKPAEFRGELLAYDGVGYALTEILACQLCAEEHVEPEPPAESDKFERLKPADRFRLVADVGSGGGGGD